MDKLFNKINIASEKEIIEKILNGETTLFEVLVRRYNAALYKIGRAHGFNHQDTEDLVQEAHVTAFHELKKLRSESAYKVWISKIMVSKCLYKIRHGHAGEVTTTDFTTPVKKNVHNAVRTNETDKKIQNGELAKVLEKSIERLPRNYKTVFVLRVVEGYSIAETAKLLHISPQNVKVRLNRAKVLLRKQLEHFYTSTELFEITLPHCDLIVQEVFDEISNEEKQRKRA